MLHFFGNKSFPISHYHFHLENSPPKTLSDFGVAIWFGIFYVIFYLFDTLSNVPYGALGPELSDVPEERDQLFFVAKLFQAVGTLMGAAGPVVFAWLVKKANLKDCSTTCFTDCTSLPAMWHNHTDINGDKTVGEREKRRKVVKHLAFGEGFDCISLVLIN